MRGEYQLRHFFVGFLLELPPHARRIHDDVHKSVTKIGTTSACAENTERTQRRTEYPGNYLRMRGEYGKR